MRNKSEKCEKKENNQKLSNQKNSLVEATFHTKTNLDNNVPLFIPYPSVIEFLDIVAFKEYKKILTLRNCDTYPRKLLLRPFQSENFIVTALLNEVPAPSIKGSTFAESGYHRVAPGLETKYEITFITNELKSYEESIFFETERELLEVKLVALIPPIKLICPKIIVFGKVTVKKLVKKIFLLRNVGNFPYEFKIISNDVNVVSEPRQATIKPGHSLQVELRVKKNHLGSLASTITIVNLNLCSQSKLVSLVGKVVEREVHFCTDALHFGLCYTSLRVTRSVTLFNQSQEILKFLWKNDVNVPFECKPRSGLVWSKGKITFLIAFNPKVCNLYKEKLHLEIDGKAHPLELACYGEGLGPTVSLKPSCFNFGNLYTQELFKGTFCLKNIGEIDTCFTFPLSESSYEVSYLPSTGKLLKGTKVDISFTFLSKASGRFNNVFCPNIEGCKETDFPKLTLKGNIVNPNLKLNKKELDFSSIGLGFSSSCSITVTNISRVSCNFTIKVFNDLDNNDLLEEKDSVVYTEISSGTLEREEVQDIKITFQPIEEGFYHKYVVLFAGADLERYIVEVSGVGVKAKLNLLRNAKKLNGSFNRHEGETAFIIDHGKVYQELSSIVKIYVQNSSEVDGKVYFSHDCNDITFNGSCAVVPANKIVPIKFKLIRNEIGHFTSKTGFLDASQKLLKKIEIMGYCSGPELEVPKMIEFNSVHCLKLEKRSFEVKNVSPIDAELYVFFDKLESSCFHIESQYCRIEPGGTASLSVTLYPNEARKFVDVLCLVDAKSQNIYDIPVRGNSIGHTLSHKGEKGHLISSRIELGTFYIGAYFQRSIQLSNLGFQKQKIEAITYSENVKIQPEKIDIDSFTSIEFSLYFQSARAMKVDQKISFFLLKEREAPESVMNILLKGHCIKPFLQFSRESLTLRYKRDSICFNREQSMLSCNVLITNTTDTLGEYSVENTNRFFTTTPNNFVIGPASSISYNVELLFEDVASQLAACLKATSPICFRNIETSLRLILPVNLQFEIPQVESNLGLIDFGGIEYEQVVSKSFSLRNVTSSAVIFSLNTYRETKSLRAWPCFGIIPPFGIVNCSLQFIPVTKFDLKQVALDNQVLFSCVNGNVSFIDVKATVGIPDYEILPENLVVDLKTLRLFSVKSFGLLVRNKGKIQFTVSFHDYNKTSFIAVPNQIEIKPEAEVNFNFKIYCSALGFVTEKILMLVKGLKYTNTYELQVNYTGFTPIILFHLYSLQDRSVYTQYSAFVKKLDNCKENIGSVQLIDQHNRDPGYGKCRKLLFNYGIQVSKRRSQLKEAVCFLINSIRAANQLFYASRKDLFGIVDYEISVGNIGLGIPFNRNIEAACWGRHFSAVAPKLNTFREELSISFIYSKTIKTLCALTYICDEAPEERLGREQTRVISITSKTICARIFFKFCLVKPCFDLNCAENFKLSIPINSIQVLPIGVTNKSSVAIKIHTTISPQISVHLTKRILVLEPEETVLLKAFCFAKHGAHQGSINFICGEFFTKTISFTVVGSTPDFVKLSYNGNNHNYGDVLKTDPVFPSMNTNTLKLEVGCQRTQELNIVRFSDFVEDFLLKGLIFSSGRKGDIIFSYDIFKNKEFRYALSKPSCQYILPTSRIHGDIDIIVYGKNMSDSSILSAVLSKELKKPILSLETLLHVVNFVDGKLEDNFFSKLNSLWISNSAFENGCILDCSLLTIDEVDNIFLAEVLKQINIIARGFNFLILELSESHNFVKNILDLKSLEFIDKGYVVLEENAPSCYQILKQSLDSRLLQYSGFESIHGEIHCIMSNIRTLLQERYVKNHRLTPIFGKIPGPFISTVYRYENSVKQDLGFQELELKMDGKNHQVLIERKSTEAKISLFTLVFLSIDFCQLEIVRLEYSCIKPVLRASVDKNEKKDLFQVQKLDLGWIPESHTIVLDFVITNANDVPVDDAILSFESATLECSFSSDQKISLLPGEQRDLVCRFKSISIKKSVSGEFCILVGVTKFRFEITARYSAPHISLQPQVESFCQYFVHSVEKASSKRLVKFSNYSKLNFQWKLCKKQTKNATLVDIDFNKVLGSLFNEKSEILQFTISSKKEVMCKLKQSFEFIPLLRFPIEPKLCIKRELDIEATFKAIMVDFLLENKPSETKELVVDFGVILRDTTLTKTVIVKNRSKTAVQLKFTSLKKGLSRIETCCGANSLQLEAVSADILSGTDYSFSMTFSPTITGRIFIPVLLVSILPKDNNNVLQKPIIEKKIVVLADVHSSRVNFNCPDMANHSRIIKRKVRYGENFSTKITISNTGIFPLNFKLGIQSLLVQEKKHCFWDKSSEERLGGHFNVIPCEGTVLPSQTMEVACTVAAKDSKIIKDVLVFHIPHTDTRYLLTNNFHFQVEFVLPKIETQDFQRIFPGIEFCPNDTKVVGTKVNMYLNTETTTLYIRESFPNRLTFIRMFLINCTGFDTLLNASIQQENKNKNRAFEINDIENGCIIVPGFQKKCVKIAVNAPTPGIFTGLLNFRLQEKSPASSNFINLEVNLHVECKNFEIKLLTSNQQEAEGTLLLSGRNPVVPLSILNTYLQPIDIVVELSNPLSGYIVCTQDIYTVQFGKIFYFSIILSHTSSSLTGLLSVKGTCGNQTNIKELSIETIPMKAHNVIPKEDVSLKIQKEVEFGQQYFAKNSENDLSLQKCFSLHNLSCYDLCYTISDSGKNISSVQPIEGQVCSLATVRQLISCKNTRKNKDFSGEFEVCVLYKSTVVHTSKVKYSGSILFYDIHETGVCISDVNKYVLSERKYQFNLELKNEGDNLQGKWEGDKVCYIMPKIISISKGKGSNNKVLLLPTGPSHYFSHKLKLESIGMAKCQTMFEIYVKKQVISALIKVLFGRENRNLTRITCLETGMFQIEVLSCITSVLITLELSNQTKVNTFVTITVMDQKKMLHTNKTSIFLKKGSSSEMSLSLNIDELRFVRETSVHVKFSIPRFRLQTISNLRIYLRGAELAFNPPLDSIERQNTCNSVIRSIKCWNNELCNLTLSLVNISISSESKQYFAIETEKQHWSLDNQSFTTINYKYTVLRKGEYEATLTFQVGADKSPLKYYIYCTV